MSQETEGAATTVALIEQKVSFVNSIVNVCMLWWASSIVFCGSVLAAVWSNRQDLLRQPVGFVIGLGLVLFVFFFVIAFFGFLVADHLGQVQDEIARLARTLKFEAYKLKYEHFHTEVATFQMSMWLGAGSFALVHVVWTLFWFYLMDLAWWYYIIFGVAGLLFWIYVWLWWWQRESR